MPVARKLEPIAVTGELGRAALGPATVVSVDGPRVEVELESGARAPVTMALTLPYRPVIGDTLLVIGDERRYAIGVIEGRGRTELLTEGDLHIHANGGALTLGADRGVRVQGPGLEVIVERFAVTASNAVQKVGTLFQRVREMMHVQAGESHVVVAGTSLQRAKKVAVVAEETASVNGKQIHLG
ncbi:MAG: DUF3540 domain-containing protein [Deltaproteobacteria bacterium]|nr:DUF3540 domain-containing protein [Deltaproteobacteria bacterium]